MTKATAILRRPAVKPDLVVDEVVLDHHARASRHAHWHSKGGLHIDLDLDKPTAIADGDALKLDDGRLVVVRAAPEALLSLKADNPSRLLKALWQLGSNHCAVEVAGDAVYVENSPSVSELVRGLGLSMEPVTRAFHPEKAAHAHHHDHDHAHGPGCGHHHHDH